MPGFPVAVGKLSITTPAPPAPPPGSVVSLNAAVTVNGSPIATVGESTWISTHGDPKVQPLCQALPPIIQGVMSIRVNAQPVAYVGSLCECGHAIATGVPSVTVTGA
jgi:uncharacterized Zn-binding protein involved in type VI secretion